MTRGLSQHPILALSPVALSAVAVAAFAVAGCGETAESEPQTQSATPSVTHEIPAGAEDEHDLLMRVVAAERGELFSGWKTIWNGPPGESRRSVLRVRRFEGGRNLVTFGDAVEASDSAAVWTYKSRHRWIDDPDLLLANYRVERMPDSPDAASVAWRDTYRIRVSGRAAGRPSLEILVDRETDLPVAETLRNHTGDILFAWEFDSLEYGPPDASDVPSAEALSDPSSEPGQVDGATGCDWPALLVGDSPAGFERVACTLRPGGELREYWSDGLAAFFVAQSPVDDGDLSEVGVLERRECGGRAAVSGVVGDVRITITGTLPIEDLERLARDLRVPSSLE